MSWASLRASYLSVTVTQLSWSRFPSTRLHWETRSQPCVDLFSFLRPEQVVTTGISLVYYYCFWLPRASLRSRSKFLFGTAGEYLLKNYLIFGLSDIHYNALVEGLTLKAGVDKSRHMSLVVLNAMVHQHCHQRKLYFNFRKGFPPVWTPRIDGIFLQDNPRKFVKAEKAANVPFVIGMHFFLSSHLR